MSSKREILIKLIIQLTIRAGAITATLIWFDWKLLVVLLLTEFAHNMEKHWGK